MFDLLAITPPEGRLSPALVARWVEVGIRPGELGVLLRTPDRSDRRSRPEELLHRFGRFADAVREAGYRPLLSCSAQAAVPEDLSVDGFQLRGDPGASSLVARRLQHPGKTIGASVHHVGSIAGSVVGGADYVCVAPIFKPTTRQRGVEKQPAGLELLRGCRAAIDEGDGPRPRVFALGGITATRAAACVEAGADGLAGIGAFFGPREDLGDNLAAFRAALGSRVSHGVPTLP